LDFQCPRFNLNLKPLKIKEDLVQVVMRSKLNLFGHIARMSNSRKLKSVMMAVMEGYQRRGRPCREGLDDIGDWCQDKIHMLSRMVFDRNEWRHLHKVCIGHLRACCLWIFMMMMMKI